MIVMGWSPSPGKDEHAPAEWLFHDPEQRKLVTD